MILAIRRQDVQRAVATLDNLCLPYRQPLYAYVRLRGHSPEEAQDLTRQFFSRLLQNKTFAYMKRDCAKLRSFLLTALNRFLSELPAAPEKPAAECGESIEMVFEHNWALALLNVVYDRLQVEYGRAGEGEVFAALKFCLASNTDALAWKDLAANLGLEEPAVKGLVQTLRRRHAEILRQEISRLIAAPAEVEEELRCLFPSLAGQPEN